jgi:putative transposase
MAFVIDVFARRIVGGGVSRSMHAELVLDGLEQPLRPRCGIEGVVHHSGRGSHYLPIRYTERLAEAGAEPSVGSVGDSYDNALAETIIRVFKTEVIHHRGPWRNMDAVEYATPEWVDWFNHLRLLEPIGHILPAELEAAYYHSTGQLPLAARRKQELSGKTGGSRCNHYLCRFLRVRNVVFAGSTRKLNNSTYCTTLICLDLKSMF